MPFPNKDTQFKPGQSGNPTGLPKGTIHLSTMIQRMLNEDIEPTDPKGKPKKHIQALIEVALVKSKEGDNKWAEWLAKYGYGQKFEVEQNISGELKTGNASAGLAEQFGEFLKGKNR